MVELEGGDNMYSIGDSEALIGEIEEFLTGERHDLREPDRMLATVLFTDICGSTEHAAEMGDRSGGSCSSATTPLPACARAPPRLRDQAPGDGFLATFDGPARAIRCAADMADAVASLGPRCAPACTPASSR